MAVREPIFDLDGAIFMDDLLQYLYERNGRFRVPIIPNAHRILFRQVAEYVFSADIGNAVRVRLLTVPRNYGLFLQDVAHIIRQSLPSPGAYLANFLRFHRIAHLTEEDFTRDTRDWCYNMIDYLAIVSNVCIHLEHRGSIITLVDVISAAADVLRVKMEERTLEKIEALEQYSRAVWSERPIIRYFIIAMN